MNTKKYFLAVLAGVIGNFIAYYILEELILKSYILSAVYGPTGAVVGGSPVLPVVAVVVLTLVMAYMYPKGYEGASPAAEGLRFGVLMGLFLGVPFAFFFGAMFPIDFGAMLVLAIVTILEIGIGGLLIGLVYGKLPLSRNPRITSGGVGL